MSSKITQEQIQRAAERRFVSVDSQTLPDSFLFAQLKKLKETADYLRESIQDLVSRDASRDELISFANDLDPNGIEVKVQLGLTAMAELVFREKRPEIRARVYEIFEEDDLYTGFSRTDVEAVVKIKEDLESR